MAHFSQVPCSDNVCAYIWYTNTYEWLRNSKKLGTLDTNQGDDLQYLVSQRERHLVASLTEQAQHMSCMLWP